MRLQSSELYPILVELDEAVSSLRQLDLKDEGSFVNWASSRGVSLSGILKETDAGVFWERGWLRSDWIEIRRSGHRTRIDGPLPSWTDTRRPGEPPPTLGEGQSWDLYFHPFRLWSCHALLLPRLGWCRSAVLFGKEPRQTTDFLTREAAAWTSSDQFQADLDWINGVADLAVLLEPLYWPNVTGWTRDYQRNREPGLKPYRERVLATLAQMDRKEVANAHEALRWDAGNLDGNDELYLILRAAGWNRRERITGALGGSMWIRHMAEVLRCGYEEVFSGRLPCEDHWSGVWYEGARRWAYGSDHPTDDLPELLKRVAPRWNIGTDVRVKIYVEGSTERGAFEDALRGWLGYGVEVVDLKGKNWGEWLVDQLRNDKQARRLSMLVLDADRPDELRSVRKHAENDLIVGMILLSDPDFEVGCFTREELVRAAELMEMEAGRAGLGPLEPAAFEQVRSGKEFEETYMRVRLAPGLKGEAWGRALSRVAFQSRSAPDDESNRFVHMAVSAMRGVTTGYEVMAKGHRINPETLELEKTGWQPGRSGAAD